MISFDVPRTKPKTARFVASVTMNDGRFVLVIIKPFIRPIRKPKDNPTNTPTSVGRCQYPERIAVVIPPAARVDPTDRSKSPAIIISATGSAITPSSQEIFSQLAVPPIAVKSDPPITAKKI